MTTQRGRGRPKGGWVDDKERKPVVSRLTSRHHTIAKLFAAGATRNEVAIAVNMTPERVGQFANDPAFQELIAQYRTDPDVVRAQGIDLIAFQRQQMVATSQRALDHANEAMDQAEAEGGHIPLSHALRAVEIFADRIGLGKHTTTTNVYDFASELETRRIARMKTIEAKVSSPSSTSLPQGEVRTQPTPRTSPTNSSGDGSGKELELVALPGSAPSLRRRSL